MATQLMQRRELSPGAKSTTLFDSP